MDGQYVYDVRGARLRGGDIRVLLRAVHVDKERADVLFCGGLRVFEQCVEVGLPLPAAGERASSPAYTDLACILSVLWEDMDVESRVETLERVLEAEAECLGIRTPRLTAACLAEDDKNANGQYNHTRDRIELDEEALMTRDGRDTLETLLHECRHAYQHSVVDMIDWSHEAAKQHAFFAEARAWREEHIGASVYNNSPEGIEEYFLEYYYTAIERDAREYARARIREIIEEMWYPEYGI